MPAALSATCRGDTWNAKPTVTEQACLLLGRFCDRTALILKEAQSATGANAQDAAKLFSSLCKTLSVDFTLFSVARCSANKDISASTLSYQVRHPADGAVHSLAVCAGDLSKALHASSRYLEACNSRSRLELLIASPGISMDLQDRLLDLADAMSTLRGCQLQVRL